MKFLVSKIQKFFRRKNFSCLVVTGDREAELQINDWWLNMNMDNTENEFTQHYERLKKLCFSDPVHTIVLKSYIESQVKFGSQSERI